MTEDEKKEFEEFLKWKAEKAQKASSTETEESPEPPVDVEEVKPQKEVVLQTNTASNTDGNKGIDNAWLYILAVVMAIVLLFTVVIALSDSKKVIFQKLKLQKKLKLILLRWLYPMMK